MKHVVAGIASSATIEYIRASCAYCARNGLKAIRIAENQAACASPRSPGRPPGGGNRQQREQQAQPAHARLLRPAMSSQKCSSM